MQKESMKQAGLATMAVAVPVIHQPFGGSVSGAVPTYVANAFLHRIRSHNVQLADVPGGLGMVKRGRVAVALAPVRLGQSMVRSATETS